MKEKDQKPKLSEFEQAREGFKRLNEVTIETNLIPRLHDLFVKKGITEEYTVFDAVEIFRVFPVPIRTRYIMPVFEEFIDEKEEPKIDEPYPGLVFFETFWPKREIKIQLGLDERDLEKVALRGQTVVLKEGENSLTVQPDWWKYDFSAIDMSRPYDFGDHIKFSQVKASKNRRKNIFQKTLQIASLPLEQVKIIGNKNKIADNESVRISLETYLTYGETNNDQLTTIVFDQKTWETEQEKVEKGFKNIEETIDKFLKQDS